MLYRQRFVLDMFEFALNQLSRDVSLSGRSIAQISNVLTRVRLDSSEMLVLSWMAYSWLRN